MSDTRLTLHPDTGSTSITVVSILMINTSCKFILTSFSMLYRYLLLIEKPLTLPTFPPHHKLISYPKGIC